MFKIRSESHERVISAAEDIKCCCEIRNDYYQWSDIAASSIQAFLEDLTAEQLDDTCSAFMEYIEEITSENPNFAQGMKEALAICLKEMIDYIGDVPETDENSEDEDHYSDYDRETINLVVIIKETLEKIDNKQS